MRQTDKQELLRPFRQSIVAAAADIWNWRKSAAFNMRDFYSSKTSEGVKTVYTNARAAH
jgi:hypothetical protein